MFWQVFKWPTQRPVSVSPLITIETKKAHKAGERSSCSAILTVGELRGHDLAALAYEIKDIRKFILWGFWSDIQKLSPMKVSRYTVDQL